METSNKTKMHSGGILFALLGLMGSFLSYYFPFFFLTMALVPAFWAAAAFRSRHGVGVLAFLTIATYVFGLVIGQSPVEALLNLGFIAPAGILLYVAQKMKLGNANCVIFLSILLTFGFFLVFCVPSIWAYGNSWEALQLFYQEALSPLYLDSTSATIAEELVSSMEWNYLSLLYSMSAEYGLVNVLVLHLLNRRHKDMDLCPLGAFGSWQLPRPYRVILSVAAIVSLVFLLWGQDSLLAADNLLVEMFMLPMYLMGAQAIYRLLRIRKSKRAAGWLTALFTAVLLLFGGYFLAMLGMFTSFRKTVVRKDQP